MSVYIPCLNVDSPDNGGGFSVGVGAGSIGGEGGGVAPGVTFTHRDSPVALTITPSYPFIYFGPNFAFWADLFGLGETRIQREKQQIQDVMTDIFRYLEFAYHVPIRDGHALQFGSDGVQAQFQRRPDIAALAPSLMTTSLPVTSLVFARKDTSQGQRERVVNQFLANASINEWPVNSTVQIWEGMVEASRPECWQDTTRWIRNPWIVRAIAEAATLVQYVPMDILGPAALTGGLANSLASRIIEQWLDNPELIKDLPQLPRPDWAVKYCYGLLAYAPGCVPGVSVIQIDMRPGARQILDSLQVETPRYPDFVDPGPGGIRPPAPRPQPPSIPPGPQPPSPPTPPQPPTLEIPSEEQIQRVMDIAQRYNRGQLPTPDELDFLRSPIGTKAVFRSMERQPWPAGLGQLVYGQPEPPPPPPQPPTPPQPPQPPTPPPGPQPPTPPTPQPPPQYPRQDPSDADYQRGCQISRMMARGLPLGQADLDWSLTVIGAKAVTWAINTPGCGYGPGEQPNNPLPPQPPDCPPVPQPPPRPPWPQPPWPPQPPQPPPGPQPCPPLCQQQIDLLKAQQKECCDRVTLGVIPRVENLERWVIDIERRVAGPRPPLPNPTPRPPYFPPPQPDPPDDVDNDGVPDAEEPPLFPPDIVECLTKLCDPEERKRERREDERKLECIRIGLCDEAGGPWGAMAECWLDKNTPDPGEVRGIFGARRYPKYGVDGVVFAWTRRFQQFAQSQGQGLSGVQLAPDSGDQARYWRIGEQLVTRIVDAYEGSEFIAAGAEDVAVETQAYIYVDHESLAVPSLKLRQVALRAGEPDPCTVEPPNVGEIPPITGAG